MTHIGEIMESLCLQASEPSTLPPSSEQVIMDLKGVDTTSFSFGQVSWSSQVGLGCAVYQVLSDIFTYTADVNI